METNRPTYQVLEGPVERAGGALTVRHRERDLPPMQPLVKHVLRAFYESCTILGFPSGYALEVDLSLPIRCPTFKGHARYGYSGRTGLNALVPQT
jgi:hypothetical protein